MNKYERMKKILLPIIERDIYGNDEETENRVLNPLTELVERATPKKVIVRKAVIGGTVTVCNCGSIQYHKGFYCYNCGQAIKWSGDNE